MCIIIRDHELIKAQEDVVVFKVMTVPANTDKYTSFTSTVKGFKYILGKKYKEKNIKAEYNNVFDQYETKAGFYSWGHFDIARYKCDLYNKLTNRKYVIVKCIIPKDPLYYKSKSDLQQEICSDTIIIKAYFDQKKHKWIDTKN